jgi:hypothetical protein
MWIIIVKYNYKIWDTRPQFIRKWKIFNPLCWNIESDSEVKMVSFLDNTEVDLQPFFKKPVFSLNQVVINIRYPNFILQTSKEVYNVDHTDKQHSFCHSTENTISMQLAL